MIVLGVGLTPPLLGLMSPLQLHRCARGIIIGLLIGMVFLLIEYSTNHAVLNSITKVFPGLIKTIHGTSQIPDHHLNPNSTVAILFMWPTFLLALAWQGDMAKKLFVTALLAASLFLLYKTESATAQLAFVFAVLAYLGTLIAPRAIDLIARGLWITAVVGAVPIIMIVHSFGLQNMTSLPYSFRDRLHIWNYTAELVPKNSVLGIGIRSGRSYTKEPSRKIPRTQPPVLVDHQGWHSHNLFLQTWYELGIVGAAFLLAIGLFLLNSISRIELQKRPFAYATFASFTVIAAFGYGMWQSWLLSAYGWAVIFLLIGLQYKGEKA